ncbi:MAG: hypothetical protein ABIF40_00355 [archaeon]
MKKVTLYGIGQIAPKVVDYLLDVPDAEIQFAVDNDPNKIGKDLGDVVGMVPLGIPIISPEDLTYGARLAVDNYVAIHMTSSKIKDVMPQIKQLIRNGYHVVSSCEEMAHLPRFHHKEFTELNDTAQAYHKTVVGTGVNPGYLMDRLAVELALKHGDVASIDVKRVVDASKRREALQRKVGSSISPQQFGGLKRHNKIGHVGLIESVALIAEGLNCHLVDYKEDLRPVLALQDYQTEFFHIRQGQVRGINHKVIGAMHSREKSPQEILASLELIMAVGEEKTGDYITITQKNGESHPYKIEPCTDGDVATSAILVDFATRLLSNARSTRAGVKSVNDFPLPDLDRYLI